MEVVVREHTAAQLALVRGAHGETRWVPFVKAPPHTSETSPIELRPKAATSLGVGRLDLDASCFPHTPHFRLVQWDEDAQNLLLFLHGRGDSHDPFARLGQQMALPQTAVLSLRAPLEMPFGLGFTWMDDLDASGDVIPPDMPHKQRSESLQAARDFVWSFLQVLHDKYEWSYSRLFVFAFSQGACVAFHLTTTLPRHVRLGGVVLVAGGAVVGVHSSASGDGRAAATPMLQVTGEADSVYPAPLAERSQCAFKRRHGQKATEELFSSLVRQRKGHAMIDSREDMQHVMLFFSKYLYLRNVELENRSDVIELQT